MLFKHIFLECLPENIWIIQEDEDFKSPHQVAHRANKLMTDHTASHMTVHAIEPTTSLATTITPIPKCIEKPKQASRLPLPLQEDGQEVRTGL